MKAYLLIKMKNPKINTEILKMKKINILKKKSQNNLTKFRERAINYFNLKLSSL
jgi:hypothetical protein